MIKKIIFLVDTLFDERDFKRFGIVELRNKGFLVEIWSIYFIKRKISNIDTSVNFIFFLEKKEFSKALDKNLKNVLIMNHIPYNFYNYFFFKELSKRKIPYCVVHLGALPVSKKNGWKNIVHHLTHFSFDRFLNKIFSSVNYRLLGIMDATYALVGSKVDQQVALMCGKKTKYILAHSFDYETYLNYKFKETSKLNTEECIVFLDEFGPFHPDLSLNNIKPLLNAKDYYSELNNFFNYLESEFSLPVVIAAHPKSKYEEMPNYFLNRLVIKGKTFELIKKSKFVLLHASTSVNFAVLSRKPLNFITSSNYKRGILKNGIMSMAKTFNSKSIIDLKKYDTYSNVKDTCVNEKIYLKYFYDYIKIKSSPDVPLWDIFAEYIKGN